MIAKEPIESLLTELQILYDNPADTNHKDYYSKLALMELCGWLEIVLDDIILNYGRVKLVEQKNIEILENEIVKKTYGCDYKDHLRIMLIKIIGITNVEKLELVLKNQGVFQILVSQLGTLWSLRKPAAHTTIVGVMITYNAPSSMKTYLNSLYPILLTLESELQNI
jgi:hypothetical protein